MFNALFSAQGTLEMLVNQTKRQQLRIPTCATPAASFMTLTVHLQTVNTFYHLTFK